MIKPAFLSIICLMSFIGQSQSKQQQLDLLKQTFQKDSAHCYRFKPVRPYFSLDNRHSFIKDAQVDVKGLQVGVILHDRHLIGFGLYGLQKSAKQTVSTRNEKNIVALRLLQMSYLTTFYQYTIINRRYFQLDVPFEIGLGSYKLNVLDTVTKTPIIPEKKGGIIVTGIGTSVILKPIKWIGLTGMAGYRAVLDGNTNLNFNGAFYSYGVWVDLRQIYRDIKFYGFIRKKYKRKARELS